MERLTKRIDERLVFPNELIGVMMTPSNETMCQILNRLSAYEDTGLEPEEIKVRESVKYNAGYYHGDEDRCRWIEKELGPIDHLRELVQAEQDGRLVVLPCKIGTPVYTTHGWKDVKEKCTDSHGKPFYRMVSKKIIKKERFNPFGPDYEWLGKTVFLTREEAEAALKGGEG